MVHASEAASNLNNAGVKHISNGDFPKALAVFREALKLTMEELEPSPPSNIPKSSMETPAQHTGSSPKEPQGSSTSPTVQVPAIFNLPHNFLIHGDSSSPFIYAKGIEVVSTPGAYSSDLMTNAAIFSGIIIFNLGCVYHAKGLEAGKMSQARLAKALSLYEKCYRLLSDANVITSSTGNAMVDFVAMAVLNNLAQVKFEQSQHLESRYFFNQLIQYSVTAVSIDYGDRHVTALMDVQRQNFLLNAIILNTPFVAAAA